ncbi:MAG: TolC family protein [Gemmatimonadaceae bacterium]|nr:TolC family protein [Gemmatimonadaceae bacterium]
MSCASALVSGLELRQLQRQLISSDAGRDVAAAPFTPVMRMFAARASERSTLDGTGTQGPTALLSTSTQYRVTVDKLLRSGVILSPSINVTRADLSTATLPPPNRASVNLAATIPLRRGLGASAFRNGEIAATREADASRSDVRQAAARAVFTSVTAFWDYVAACRRLDIQRQAERRANELTIETRTLVQADERSASELHSLDANAALKRITRIAAEQTVLEARQRLGLVLGVNAEDLARLGTPATAFPSARRVHRPRHTA